MKAVILAGGFGTRLSEETTVRPKPMVEIGERPILWHIMKLYSAHGIDDFVICLGYRAEVIKDYFANYYLRSSDMTVDLAKNEVQLTARGVEPWRVTLVDTGPDTMTGGRLKKVAEHIGDETFCFAYGDCVTDLDVTKLIEFHRSEGASDPDRDPPTWALRRARRRRGDDHQASTKSRRATAAGSTAASSSWSRRS